MLVPEAVEAGFYNSMIESAKISRKRKTSMFEIELPAEDGGVSYIGENFHNISKNTIILAKPDEIRHTKFPFKCFYVHVLVKDEQLSRILSSLPSFMETDRVDFYKEIFVEMVNRFNSRDEFDNILADSLLLKLIYALSKEFSFKNKWGLSHNHVVEKAISYVNGHFTENLSLEKVAEAVSCSPIHFHNTFKKNVGRTLRDFIEEKRIKKSTDLLITTDFSLTEIAYECGFSSQSYFSYVFKRRMKMTPRQYVKEINARYGRK